MIVSCRTGAVVLGAPSSALMDRAEQQLDAIGRVGVVGPDECPGVAGVVGVFVGVAVDADADGAQGAHDVGAAGVAVVVELLAGPLPGYEAAASGIAEGVAAVGFAGAAAGDELGVRSFRLAP
jgi:hypothetical protein